MGESIKAQIRVADPKFNTNNLQDYKLILRISPHGITLVVADKKQRKFVLLENYILSDNDFSDVIGLFEKITTQYSWIQDVLDSTQVIVVNKKATIIPFSLYDEAEKRSYLSFNVDLESEEEVFAEKIPALRAFCVYALPGKLKYILEKHLNQPEIKHFLSTKTNSLIEQYGSTTKETAFHLSVSRDMFFVHVIKGKELLFNNTFNFSTPDEFIFYTLNVVEQLKLNPKKVSVILTGDIDHNISLFKVLGERFPKLSFAKIQYPYSFSEAFNEISLHVYHSIFSSPE